jgi:hypothetical protein
MTLRELSGVLKMWHSSDMIEILKDFYSTTEEF